MSRYQGTLLPSGLEDRKTETETRKSVLDLLKKINEVYATDIAPMIPTASGDAGCVTGSLTQASAVSLSSGTATNISSVALTKGLWDISISPSFLPSTTTSVTVLRYGVSLLATTLITGATVGDYPNASGEFAQRFPLLNPTVFGAANAFGVAYPTYRINVTAPVTLYMNVVSNFTVSTMVAWGWIQARRVLAT